MNTCEDIEILASAFVDDELGRDETVGLLDHLAVCDSCRLFYRQSRALGEALSGSPAPAVLTESAWRRIEARAQRRSALPAWGLRAAAGIVVALLLWQVSQLRLPPLEESKPTDVAFHDRAPAEEPGAGPIEVNLEDSKGTMSDGRFIELTSEVLRADRRYHVAMLQVLTEVNEATGIARVSEESTSREGESGESVGEWSDGEVKS
jgi:hypothetical protein